MTLYEELTNGLNSAIEAKKKNLSPAQIDMIRQTQATLAIENISVTETGIEELKHLVKDTVSREAYQKNLNEHYRNSEQQ